jgi:hypothetical protein
MSAARRDRPSRAGRRTVGRCTAACRTAGYPEAGVLPPGQTQAGPRSRGEPSGRGETSSSGLNVTGIRRRRKTVTISAKEIEMFWAIGGAILYFVLIVTLGVMTLRKGHWVMFIIGIFLPFFWLIGAIMPSRRVAY